MEPLMISDYAGAMAALKHADLAQGLYDDGRLVMQDALITLHGEAHTQRRLTEFGVFNRAFFRTYESQIFPQTIAPIIGHYVAAGRADLVELGYRVTMNLTADFAGIDRAATLQDTEALLALVKTFSAGATLVHSTRDRERIEAAVRRALSEFEQRFLKPSVARRKQLLRTRQPLPNDVLSKLLQSDLDLPPGVMRREMAFYLQAGAHSTANSTVHAVHEVLTWCGDDPARRNRFADKRAVQQAVHESLRLHPASPVAWRKAVKSIELAGGVLTAGERLIIDLQAANRDASVFGKDADQFDPQRPLPANVWPYGLTFGYGVHACLGKALDGGVVPRDGARDHQQFGIVTLLVHLLLQHGAAWIDADPPRADADTSRANWGYYPVALKEVA